nr:PREDICTED: uncharacterized protein LOC109040247 [Bemisia tabaci]
MHNSLIAALVICFLTRFSGADAGTTYWNATLYRDVSQNNVLQEVSGVLCQDVDASNHDKTSSINTHDTCVIVYAEPGCKGNHKKIQPGTPHHDDFEQLGFNDVLSSVGPC